MASSPLFAVQAAATPSAAPTGETSDARSTAFKAVQGGNELQSGEKLLVEAYAAIWIVVFVMVLLSWRRQRSIDGRVDALEAALRKARARSGDGDG